MEHPIARALIPVPTHSYYDLGNGSLIIPEDNCFCKAWLKSRGSEYEKTVANVSQWIAFGVSVAFLIFYAYEAWMAICGWEEVYVCCVELTKVVLEFWHEFDHPAMIYSAAGNRVQWLRYGEWLLTCPVILIHLSNLTGLKEDYTFRTMRLLVSDIGTIVFGATSAYCTGYLKLIFFLISCVYGIFTFFNAGKVYVEAYNAVPQGKCQWLVKVNAFIFFSSWTMYPVLFALGPEGFGVLSVYGSTIAHSYLDLCSKNIWGLVGHFLRVAVWRHVRANGEQSVVGMRNSMSVARPRLSIDPAKGGRLSISSQSGAVPAVSSSGITWTTSGEPSGAASRKVSTDTGVRSSSGSPHVNGGASPGVTASQGQASSLRSHFWSTNGKHNATVAPAPSPLGAGAGAGGAIPQAVSVKSRANTANGMNGGRDAGGAGAMSSDVIAASDVVVARVTASGPLSPVVSPASEPIHFQAGRPPSRALETAAPHGGGGWTGVNSPGGGAAQPRPSTSNRDGARTSTSSLRLGIAPTVPVSEVDDIDEEGEAVTTRLPPPPATGRRVSAEGASRPSTSQVLAQGAPSPRGYPNLKPADI